MELKMSISTADKSEESIQFPMIHLIMSQKKLKRCQKLVWLFSKCIIEWEEQHRRQH